MSADTKHEASLAEVVSAVPLSSTMTVDQAAAVAGCNAREFGHRARAAGVEPLHFVRVDRRMRAVYAERDVEVVANGGPGSLLAFDLVAADLGITSNALAEVVVRHAPGYSLAVPSRYRSTAADRKYVQRGAA